MRSQVSPCVLFPSSPSIPRPAHPIRTPDISWAICPFFVPLPPSPRPPKPRAPLRAPSYSHPLPAHLVRPSHPVRVPLRPRRTSAPFHPSPRTPHPHPAYLLGYMPIFLPPSPFPPRRSLPNPAPRFARLPICIRSLAPHPRAPPASSHIRILPSLAPHTPSAPIRTRPHPSHPVRTPAYLLGYIPSRIRRSPSSSSLYVYRRS